MHYVLEHNASRRGIMSWKIRTGHHFLYITEAPQLCRGVALLCLAQCTAQWNHKIIEALWRKSYCMLSELCLTHSSSSSNWIIAQNIHVKAPKGRWEENRQLWCGLSQVLILLQLNIYGKSWGNAPIKPETSGAVSSRRGGHTIRWKVSRRATNGTWLHWRFFLSIKPTHKGNWRGQVVLVQQEINF